MRKPRKKEKFPVICSCGCNETFYTNRKNKKYRNKQHKMRAFEATHKRQKIGVNTVGIIEADGTLRLPTGMRIKLIALPPKGASNG